METTNNKLPLHKVGRKSNAFFKARKQAKCKVGDQVWIAFYNQEFTKAVLLREEYFCKVRNCNRVEVNFISAVDTTHLSCSLDAHEYAETLEALVKKLCKYYDSKKGEAIERLLKWEKEQEEMEQEALEQEANQGKEVQDAKE